MNIRERLNALLSDDDRRRRYAQNSAIIDAAIALNKALEAAGRSQKDLADRMDRTEGFVSQVLSGGSNLTLTTLGDFAWGLDCDLDISFRPRDWACAALTTETWTSQEIAPPKAANTQLALAA